MKSPRLLKTAAIISAVLSVDRSGPPTDELSRTTVQVALRVLAGESPGNIKTPTQHAGRPTYDARELRRWNIDQGRLPPASIVLFREPTFWQRYQAPITFGALLGGIPVVAIVLLVGRIKRPSRPEPRTDCEARLPAGSRGRDGQGVDRGHRWPARGRWPSSRRHATRRVDGPHTSR